ncbi:MAG: 50S ribosomal protein L24 [Legionellales bacterium RIFCSPHIGHO2_12_FULL_37_14]|nr:MAG: 50S ribosomal protein L24 [Legionellales bacterium RIFCSPHIGHO2_12_FULL_37_14]
MLRIKTGDTVVIVTGKSKGHIGKVLKVHLDKNRLIVEGGNLVKRHMKPRSQNDAGGIITKEASIHVSNVAMYNPVTKKKDKVGFKVIERSGKKQRVRYFKSNKELIDTGVGGKHG